MSQDSPKTSLSQFIQKTSVYHAQTKIYKITGSIFTQGDVSIRLGYMTEPKLVLLQLCYEPYINLTKKTRTDMQTAVFNDGGEHLMQEIAQYALGIDKT